MTVNLADVIKRIVDEQILRGLLKLEFPDNTEKQEAFMRRVYVAWTLNDFARFIRDEL